MTRIKKAWLMLTSNPYSFICYLITRIRAYFISSKLTDTVRKNVNGIQFEFDFGYAPCVKSMYAGTYQYFVTDIIRRVLREGDTFRVLSDFRL